MQVERRRDQVEVDRTDGGSFELPVGWRETVGRRRRSYREGEELQPPAVEQEVQRWVDLDGVDERVDVLDLEEPQQERLELERLWRRSNH